MRKSNESFSVKGHAVHICKACSRLSPAHQAEQMTLRHLENLPLRRLTEGKMKWLKNRIHDHRPEVKALACMVYAERFPRLARNQKKQELSIQTLTLSVNGDICDPYGDLVYVKESYQFSRTPPTIVRTHQDGTPQAIELPTKILAKLLTGWLLAALPLRAIASPLRGSGQYTHWRFSGGKRIIAILSMLSWRPSLPCGVSMWNTPTGKFRI